MFVESLRRDQLAAAGVEKLCPRIVHVRIEDEDAVQAALQTLSYRIRPRLKPGFGRRILGSWIQSASGSSVLFRDPSDMVQEGEEEAAGAAAEDAPMKCAPCPLTTKGVPCTVHSDQHSADPVGTPSGATVHDEWDHPAGLAALEKERAGRRGAEPGGKPQAQADLHQAAGTERPRMPTPPPAPPPPPPYEEGNEGSEWEEPIPTVDLVPPPAPISLGPPPPKARHARQAPRGAEEKAEETRNGGDRRGQREDVGWR